MIFKGYHKIHHKLINQSHNEIKSGIEDTNEERCHGVGGGCSISIFDCCLVRQILDIEVNQEHCYEA